jgi:uncharacterized LabA/DUF88 family protein
VTESDERIGLYLDYENLAIGARNHLGAKFEFAPVADAMAERGRVLVRKAYADWSAFDSDRRMLTRHQVELIEIPQRMGASRKNAADIKLAVDAIELAFERDYITTFVIGTGDSDFTPLVHKLRELDKRVIGVGVGASTSGLLPPACDEFLFYESLASGIEPPPSEDEAEAKPRRSEDRDVRGLVVGTVAGLQRSPDVAVRASTLKRAILRKDPTFNEGDHGFRSFGDLLRDLEANGALNLDGRGDPEITLSASDDADRGAMDALKAIVAESGTVPLSGLKDGLRKKVPGFSEKALGYGGFLQFCKAARSKGFVDLEWSEELGDYEVSAA